MSDASTRIDPEKDRRLGEAVAAYFAAVEAGGEPDRDAILAAYPDLAADLAEFFDQEERLGRIVGPFRSTEPAGVDVEATLAGPADGAGDEATLGLPEVAANGRADPLARGVRVRYFGDYELSGVLGRGGMGIVYKATQLSLNRVVALKMIRSGHWADDDEVRRFRNEAEAVANLDHPLILPIYEVGRCDEQHYFSMKFVPGGSLEKRLGEFQADVRAAAWLVSEVARAVHHAHQRGLLHRDLKPSNILLDAEDRPHVADFGLAKRIEGDGAATISGAIVGSPPYMSPEQASGRGRAVTTSTDVYGLGALLYACLTGVPPFHDDDVAATLRRVIEQPPAAPSRLNPRVDRDLETICLKCLEKDPKRRYDSASALADDLDRWLRGEPIVARRTGGWERALKWSRRRPAAAALVAMSGIAALTLAGLGVALVYQSRLQAAYDEKDAALSRELTFLYYNRINFADRELERNNTYRTERLLDQCPTDRLGWEWHYLKRQCHAELLKVAIGDGMGAYASFSPDGRLIATAGLDRKAVRLWETDTGREVDTPDIPNLGICAAAFSPDGARIAAVTGTNNDRSGELTIFEVATRRVLVSLPIESNYLGTVAYCADGKGIVATSGHRKPGWIQVRDADTGGIRLSIPLADHLVNSASFSPDGEQLVAGIGAGDSMRSMEESASTAHVYNVKTGVLVRRLGGERASARRPSFSPDGRLLATAGDVARIWNVADGRELLAYRGHRGPVDGVDFSPDGRHVASTSMDDGSTRVWDVETGQDVVLIREHRADFMSVDFSPDGRLLLTSSRDGEIRIWDATSDKASRTWRGHASRAAAAVFSPDGRYLITGGTDHAVKIWEPSTSRLAAELVGHTTPVWDVAISPDGTRIATAGGDWERHDQLGEVFIWDAASRRLLHRLRAHRAIAWSVAFSPDGRRIVSGGGEFRTPGQEVVVWDADTGLRLHTFPDLEGGVPHVAFSPDGRRIAAAVGNVLHTWDAETGRDRVTSSGHTHRIRNFAYTPNGQRLITASYDQTVKVWNAANGAQIRSLDGSSWVNAVTISADGRRIVSCGSDEVVRIWDAESDQELIHLRGHTETINAVAFSPDGGLIVSVDDGGMVRVWDGTPPEGGVR